jgi:DNA helicase-2/ATP-dependent DNA helicase PcrA
MKRSGEYMQLSKVSDKLTAFTDFIERMASLSQTVGVAELISTVVEDSGYHDMLIDEGETGIERLRNIDELLAGAASYEESSDSPSLTEYLEDVALISDTDNYDATADAVVMMTIHSAKGLEFPVVFLPGLEEGIFPGQQSVIDDEEIEEERRLAYVAITRAKSKLYMLNARERMMYAKTRYNPPSRFLEEIPQEYKEDTTDSNSIYAATGYGFGGKSSRYGGRVGYADFYSGSRNLFSGNPEEREVRFGETEKIHAKKQSVNVGSSTSYSIGDTVTHKAFGTGVILSVKPMGNDCLLEIAFDRAGTKKVMANFAKLTKV